MYFSSELLSYAQSYFKTVFIKNTQYIGIVNVKHYIIVITYRYIKEYKYGGKNKKLVHIFIDRLKIFSLNYASIFTQKLSKNYQAHTVYF